MFIGYNSVSTDYKLFDPDTETIIVSKDVVFDEAFYSEGAKSSLDLLGDPSDNFSPSPSLPFTHDIDDVLVEDDGVSHSDDANIVDTSHLPLWVRKVVEDSKVDISTLDLQPPVAGQRFSQSNKDRASIAEFPHPNYALMTYVLVAKKPSHIGEALLDPIWRHAMAAKLASIEKKWDLGLGSFST